MPIRKIVLASLRNDLHFQFHTEFRARVLANDAEALKVKELFDAYLPLYERENMAFKKTTKSEFTEKIQKAGADRSTIYRGIKEINSISLRHFDPLTRDAASRLKTVFDTHGKLANKPISEQTSAICNMVQDFKGKYSADVAAIGVTDWVAELDARNAVFEDLVKQRDDEIAAKMPFVLRKVRADIDNVYYAIARRIDAYIELYGINGYEQFTKTLDVMIDNHNDKYIRQRSAAQTKKENADSVQQTPPA